MRPSDRIDEAEGLLDLVHADLVVVVAAGIGRLVDEARRKSVGYVVDELGLVRGVQKRGLRNRERRNERQQQRQGHHTSRKIQPWDRNEHEVTPPDKSEWFGLQELCVRGPRGIGLRRGGRPGT
jgi:hypothetical protein